jgi:hypothetical protein
MQIKHETYSHYWTCGDGCCSSYDEVSIFHHGDKTYEYRSYATEQNLLEFLREAMNIEIVTEVVDNPFGG